MSKYLPIGERLREERERFGLNQADFAAIGGSTRKTQYNYEAGERAPDGGFLAAIATAGADVQYILTGIRSNSFVQEPPRYAVLNKREEALIDNYRHIVDEGDKGVVERTALMAARANQVETQSRTKQKKA